MHVVQNEKKNVHKNGPPPNVHFHNLASTSSMSFHIFSQEEPIRGFRVGEHLEYMQQLEKKFRKTILGDLLNISKP